MQHKTQVTDRGGRTFDVTVDVDVDAIIQSLFGRARDKGRATALGGGVRLVVVAR